MLSAGCDAPPQAPALRDDPVYQNNQEGFRFLVPTDWKQFASAVLPPGKLVKERLLVQYRRMSGEEGASLTVSMRDLPEGSDQTLSDLARQVKVAARSAKWTLIGGPESVAVGQKTGARLRYEGESAGRRLAREVAVVPNGQRLYCFVGLFSPEDISAREEIRRTIASVIWRE